jgi:pyridoxal phosphate-dependent aminotransferase EpsN
MSNILAGIGRGQIQVLEDRVKARRKNFEFYENELGDLPSVSFMPEASWGRHSRWLTVMKIAPQSTGVDREILRLALEANNIEARPVWKPMHLQPIFERFDGVGGEVAESLFSDGLCLPSGSSLEFKDQKRIVEIIKEVFQNGSDQGKGLL